MPLKRLLVVLVVAGFLSLGLAGCGTSNGFNDNGFNGGNFNSGATFTTLNQPDANQPTGQFILPALQVAFVDNGGNIILSQGTVTVSINNNPGNGTLSGTLSQPLVNGIATFNDLSINNPGNGYTLTFNGLGNVAFSSPFNEVVPVATSLFFINQIPNSTTAGTFDVQVGVLDQFGDPVNTNTPISLLINNDASAGRNAVLSGAGPVVPTNGVADFPAVNINQTGNGYTLIATGQNLNTSAPSNPFNITP